jgi:hypothetical protein
MMVALANPTVFDFSASDDEYIVCLCDASKATVPGTCDLAVPADWTAPDVVNNILPFNLDIGDTMVDKQSFVDANEQKLVFGGLDGEVRVPAGCANGTQDGDESGVDTGGSCADKDKADKIGFLDATGTCGVDPVDVSFFFMDGVGDELIIDVTSSIIPNNNNKICACKAERSATGMCDDATVTDWGRATEDEDVHFN